MSREAKTKSNAHWGILMKEAQDGNQASYQQLLKELTLAMRSYLKKRINDTDAVEDLVQEVLMGIHKARSTYDPKKASFKFSYLRQKAEAACALFCSKNKKQVYPIICRNFDNLALGN